MPNSLAANATAPIEAGSSIRMPARLADRLAAERDRWLLWLPALVGTGIGLYFALRNEPPPWLGPGLTALLGAVVVLAGRTEPRLAAWRPMLVGVLAIAAGFAAAQLQAQSLQTRTLARPVGPAVVTGRVVRAEIFPDGRRLTLDQVRVSRLPAAGTPDRVRLRLRGEQPVVVPGARVAVRAMLVPPPPPSVPGGFDYQRQAYFEGVGAIGYSVGTAEIGAAPDDASEVALEPSALWTGIGVWFARLRLIVNQRVAACLDGPAAAVTMALLTGEQRAIPDTEMAAIRDSGLAHLLSISGLHIGLVAGFVLFVIRGILALIPPLALRFPIKKWAAIASVLAAGAYTLLADAPVPSQRSFFMIAIVLLAVLVDRQGISLRLVAVAALVVLLTQPASMLGPSFQMSFAAVVALISAYEALRERPRAPREQPSPAARAALYLGGVVLSTLIAGTATAPFAAYHFNRFQVYSVAANMLAVPVTSFWIMPCAAIALLAMPFGLDAPVLVAMSWGVDVVIEVARTIAAWPGAVVLLPPMPTWGLVLITFGGLWLCLWRRRWRLLGILPVVAGVAAMLTARVPDLFVDGAGKLVAVRGEGGGLILSSKTAARSARDAWLRRAGEQQAAGYWPKPGGAGSDGLRCDSLGCVFRARAGNAPDQTPVRTPDGAGEGDAGEGQPGRRQQGRPYLVAIAWRGEALAEDCRRARVVISLVPVRGRCASAEAVIDRFDLWRNGAHALWLDPGGVRIASVNGLRGDRPWVLRPESDRNDADVRSSRPQKPAPDGAVGAPRSYLQERMPREDALGTGKRAVERAGKTATDGDRRGAAAAAVPDGGSAGGREGEEETDPDAEGDPGSDAETAGDSPAR